MGVDIMAGGDIYLSEMLKTLQASMAGLQTDMGTMSTDMANVVAELINVKGVIAQGVNEVIVKPGTDVSVVLNDTDESNTGVTPAVLVEFVCMCSGVFTFSGEAKTNNVNNMYYVNMSYTINGGSGVSLGSVHGYNAYVPFNWNINVMKGDVVKISFVTNNSGVNGTVKSGSIVSYDLEDIVNNGAIVIK
jgi:hypothetical protein